MGLELQLFSKKQKQIYSNFLTQVDEKFSFVTSEFPTHKYGRHEVDYCKFFLTALNVSSVGLTMSFSGAILSRAY